MPRGLQKEEDGGLVQGEGWLCRWHAASPAHPLAFPVHQRVDAKALLHRRRPSQPFGFSQSCLPQKREHGIVCPTLHARRKQPEVAHVVTVAVWHVVGERGQESANAVRAGSLK